MSHFATEPDPGSEEPMNGEDSGAPPRALFPRAWQYYDGVIATIGLIFILTNTLVGAHLFNDQVQRWIAVGVALMTAVMIWLRQRAVALGVIKPATADHLRPEGKGDGRGSNPPPAH